MQGTFGHTQFQRVPLWVRAQAPAAAAHLESLDVRCGPGYASREALAEGKDRWAVEEGTRPGGMAAPSHAPGPKRT